MSNTNPKRNWFSNLFSSLSTPRDLHSSTCSLSISSSAIKKSASKLTDLDKTSNQDCFRIYSDNSNTRTPSLSRFISLQRLNSVGGTDFEPNRFSYPPSKGETDSYLMGNILHPSLFLKGLPEYHRSEIPPCETNQQSFLGNKISQVGNFLVSTLHNMSEKVSTPVLYPTAFHTSSSGVVRRETSYPMEDSQSLKEFDSETKLVRLSRDVKPISLNTVTCARAADAASNAKKLAPLSSDLNANKYTNTSDGDATAPMPQSNKICMEKNISQQDAASDSIPSYGEATKLPVPQCVDCFVKPLCTSYSVKSDRDQNVCAAASNECLFGNKDCTIYKFETFCDDCCSEASFASKSTDDFSYHSASTDDEWSNSECNFDDETDSESSQWERLTSFRTPWTCEQYHRKQNNSRKSDNPVSYSLPQSSSDQSIKFEEDTLTASGRTSKRKKRHSFEFHSVDENQLKDPVTRPACLNSNISFILGWPDDSDGYDSDDEDDFSWFDDTEDREFVSSGEPRPVVENTHGCQSMQCEVGDGGSSTSSCSNSCRLWEYFTNSHNPLSNIVSTISPGKEKECKRSRNSSVTEKTETKTDNNQAKDDFYKTPSKVSCHFLFVLHF